MYDSGDAETWHPESISTGQNIYLDASSCGSAHVIKIKSDSHINVNRNESYPLHSTPLDATMNDDNEHPSALLPSKVTPSTSPSVSSDEEERGRKREDETEEEREKEENEQEWQEDRGREGKGAVCSSHSDDVFSLPAEHQATTPLRSSRGNIKKAHSDSKFKELRASGGGSDLLPPLPTLMRTRRPYTSPGCNSQRCSTNSYSSPTHHQPTSTRSVADISEHSSAFMRKRSKPTRRGRSNRIHPENQPPNLSISLPPHSSTVGGTSSKSASQHSLGMGRTLSSTDSMSSTLSATLTPLLTASLRKGAGGSQPGSSSAWDFDAEAQLEGCFPDRHLQVLVVTWNMQQLKVW